MIKAQVLPSSANPRRSQLRPYHTCKPTLLVGYHPLALPNSFWLAPAAPAAPAAPSPPAGAYSSTHGRLGDANRQTTSFHSAARRKYLGSLSMWGLINIPGPQLTQGRPPTDWGVLESPKVLKDNVCPKRTFWWISFLWGERNPIDGIRSLKKSRPCQPLRALRCEGHVKAEGSRRVFGQNSLAPPTWVWLFHNIVFFRFVASWLALKRNYSIQKGAHLKGDQPFLA